MIIIWENTIGGFYFNDKQKMAINFAIVLTNL